LTVTSPSDIGAGFAPAAPDILIAAVSDPPSTLLPGGSFVVTATTANQGNTQVAASTTRFYLSQNDQKDSGDLLFATATAVPILNAGGSVTVSTTLVAPSTATGPYRLLACADDLNVVAEAVEGNNCRAAGTVTIQRPDLVPTTLSGVPASVAPGGTFIVTDTVQNTGAVGTTYGSRNRYYLASAPARTPGDYMFTVYRTVLALGSGASSTGYVTLAVPTTTALGSYWVIVCADDLGAIAETDENNNCLTSPTALLVSRPDLVETAVSTTALSVAPGGTLYVTDTVVNGGNAPAGSSITQYYLSPDGQKATGMLLGGNRSVPTLAAGATSTGSRSVAVPASTPSGTYYVVACADDFGTVVEVSDANCVASAAALPVGWPDLTTTALAEPAAAVAVGKYLLVSDTVTNQGGVTSAASTTRYYLSTDNVRSGDDILLIYGRWVPSLAPAATSSGTLWARLPTTVPIGSYFLLACSDDLSSVAEGVGEGNNCRSSNGTVAVRLPDLAVTSVSNPPANTAPGSTFVVTDTVTNQGTIGASTGRNQYYLTVTGVKSGAVPLTGFRTVYTVAAGASNTGTATLTVPAGTPSGTYLVLACADDTSVDLESDESNNCRASAGTTTLP
jgi:subtilase family serine protease